MKIEFSKKKKKNFGSRIWYYFSFTLVDIQREKFRVLLFLTKQVTYITFSFSNHFMFVFHFRESNHIMLRNSVNISAIKLINGDCCRLTDVIFWSLVKYFFRPSNVAFDSNFFGKYLLQENNLFTLLKMRISNLYVAWVDTEWVPKILNYFLFARYSPTQQLYN